MLLVIVRVETMGLWCKEGKEWLNKLGWRINDVTGDIKAINLYTEALYSTKSHSATLNAKQQMFRNYFFVFWLKPIYKLI